VRRPSFAVVHANRSARLVEESIILPFADVHRRRTSAACASTARPGELPVVARADAVAQFRPTTTIARLEPANGQTFAARTCDHGSTTVSLATAVDA